MKKRILSAIMAVIIGLSAFIPVFAEGEVTDHLVIAAFYAGAVDEEGNAASGVPVSHSFIEIYNPTNEEISLNGYSIQYQPYPTQFAEQRSGWEVFTFDSSAVIPAKCSYLIGCGTNDTDGSVELTQFDAQWEDVSLCTKGGKAVLLSTTAPLGDEVVNPFNTDGEGTKVDGYVDMIGTAGNDQGETDAIDGCETNPVAGQSKKKGFIRTDRNVDTDDNGADFEVVDYSDPSPAMPRSLADGPLEQEDPGETDPIVTVNYNSENGKIQYLGSYSVGASNPDGGVAEIVKYNSDNQKMYIVSGQEQQIDIVDLSGLKDGDTSFSNAVSLKLDAMAAEHGFDCGDITSVDVNTQRDLIAVAVQAAAYNQAGAVVLLDYDGNYQTHFSTGVQPDMVCFTPDGNAVLTADEGEPRNGYEAGEDPAGSITMVDLSQGIDNATAQTVGFEKFDAQRDNLVNEGVLLKTGLMPSQDFEPEYIAVSADSKTAYVSLQEANSIAVFDLTEQEFISVKSLGLKDHSQAGNEIDALRNDQVELKTMENLYGVYMPDGIACVNIGGVDYILTANEGDASEWEEYANIKEVSLDPDAKDTEVLDAGKIDGLDDQDGTVNFMLGGRSFSILRASDLTTVYESGSDFENITAQSWNKAFFNTSNDEVGMDKRSAKKGPEPEDIKTLQVGETTYAFIGLERISGVMMYDISDPANATYVDYISTRDYSEDIKGDVSVEGLCTIPAQSSPTGYPLILAAHEVSGTVAVYSLTEGYIAPQQPVDENPSIPGSNNSDANIDFTDDSATAIDPGKENPNTGGPELRVEPAILWTIAGLAGSGAILSLVIGERYQ